MQSNQNDLVFDYLKDMANILRIHSLQITEKTNLGNPKSCSSLAEILSVLFFHEQGMSYTPKNPTHFYSDHLLISKNSKLPILYSVWGKAGFFDIEEFEKIKDYSSYFQGFIDVTAGSLGQGLGVCCGMAYSSKYIDKINNYYFSIIAEKETVQGSFWEAINFASFYKLDNIISIIYSNFIYGDDKVTKLSKRLEAFGWYTIIISGHNIAEIIEALKIAKISKEKPCCIIAKTVQGKYYISEILKQQGKVLEKLDLESLIQTIKPLLKNSEAYSTATVPSENIGEQSINDQLKERIHFNLPNLNYQKGKEIATRIGIGSAMKRLGYQSKNIVVLDAETKTSTYSCLFQEVHPDNFIECYISEQNMIAVATGLHFRGKIPFSNSFGAFLTRAYDQIRLAAIFKANLKIHGTHGGVSVGEDGASQMGLEEFALYKPIPEMAILYPSDAVSAEKAVEIAANTKGMFYIRGSRPGTPVIYDNEETFQLGKCKVIRKSKNDRLCVVAAGITLYESLLAHDFLEKNDIHIGVIDLFSVKPIDAQGLLKNAKESHNIILVVEDHYINGGLKNSICEALKEEDNLKIFGLGLQEIPRSGKCIDLLKLYGIDSQSIINKIKEILL